ncbi:MAG: hypothetical protein COB81_01490 [Flavobacteriaceae bacterium]|nr:MAG: hypothetical protein COB81_01490 [Flavobacteriaceae bacterium]
MVIRANGNDVLAFEDESGVPKWHWNLLANGLNFVESGILDFRLFLKNGGNVGINTNNPTAKLHVAGDMQLDQAFKDKDGDVGVSGQILSSTSTGTDWITNVTGDNIYNADGNLTEDRSINGAGTFNLNFDALNFFRVNTVDEIILTAQTFTTINAPSGIILKNRVRINGMLSGDNWNGGIAGQILSSTGTNIEWIDNTSANSIYTTNGTLTTDRILEGNTNSLSFENLGTFTTNVINRVSNSTNTQIFATNAIQLQSTGGTVQIAGPSGIQLQNNTAVAGNLSVTGSYNDSTTDSGITGEVLSSTGTGTDWHPLVSTDANNAVTTGTDKGVYVKKQQIIFLTKESNTTQTWNNPDTQVESHTIELFEESIVNLNYIFTFRRNNGNGGRYRGVNIDISGSTSLNNQMSTLTNTYSNSEIWGTCAASRNFKLIPGTYTFSMRTFGNHNCTTQSQSNNMYGWSFDITATPIN